MRSIWLRLLKFTGLITVWCLASVAGGLPSLEWLLVSSAAHLVPEPRNHDQQWWWPEPMVRNLWIWGPVVGASVGEMMVAGAHVVGRPRKAAKAKTNNGSLLKLMSIELVMLSNSLILCFLFPFSFSFSLS